MSETLAKINDLKTEIFSLKETSELYQSEIQQEITSIDQQILITKLKLEETLENTYSLKNEYKKSENQIVSLQFSLENCKKILKTHAQQRNELENLNDHWEKSIRTLEFYNNDLESQLNQAESHILNLHSKIQDTSFQCQESFQKIQAECEEMKSVLMNKSRSPSPVSRPPLPIRSPMQLAKLTTINIVSKPVLSESYKIVIVAPDTLYLSENAVVVKENSFKRIFEFNRVVKHSKFTNELHELADNTHIGRNTCLVLSSGKHRREFVLETINKLSVILNSKTAEINCVEIVKDQLFNLFSYEWQTLSVTDSESFIKEAFKRLSRGKNHLLVTFKFSECALQVLDLGEVSEDQTLSESLSLNASLFYLEELMMGLSKGKPRFDKSNLTQKLQISLKSDFFLMFLMNFDDISDLPVLRLSARLQSMFTRNQTEHEEVHRTIAMLEKERSANLDVLRVIEKAQKDLALLKRVQKEKDRVIEELQNKMREDRKVSLSPTLSPLPPVSPGFRRPTKIPIPRPVKKD